MRTRPYEEQGRALLGACVAVYQEKGNGFPEGVYQECLSIELALRGMPYREQPHLSLHYRRHLLRQQYIPDFVVHDVILVELKVLSRLADEHRSQLVNALRATGLRIGFLVNFGHAPRLEYERVIL